MTISPKRIVFKNVGQSYWINNENAQERWSIQRNDAFFIHNVKYTIYLNGIFKTGEIKTPKEARQWIENYRKDKNVLAPQGENI